MGSPRSARAEEAAEARCEGLNVDAMSSILWYRDELGREPPKIQNLMLGFFLYISFGDIDTVSLNFKAAAWH